MSRALAAHHSAFGRACLYEMTRPMAMHAHRESHLLFHVSGPVSTCTVSGTPVSPSIETAIAVNPWQPHDFTPVECSQPVVLLLLYVNPSWFLDHGDTADASLHFGSTTIDMSVDLRRRVGRIVDHLVLDDAAPDLSTQLHQLTQACYQSSWSHQEAASRCAREHPVSRDHRIRKSIVLMKEQVGDTLSLDEIASAAGLSRPHFYRLFRENLGITPNVYLNTLRMELAIDRLVKTDQAVTSIGLDLGFASQASFTRFFGANVGIPPTDYRRVAHFC